MTKAYLAATALAATLVAAPGLALAQNGGNGGGGYGGGNGPTSTIGSNWNGNGGNGNFNNANRGNNGLAYNQPNNFSNGVAFGNIGLGGYSGLAMPIPNNNGNNNNNNNNANNVRPSQRNPLLADNGDVRASQMMGTNIHNARDQQVGSVDDVLIGRNGVWVIVSTNNKKVAVPFRDFVFGDSNLNGDDKLVLPNVTQAELNTLPVFHYNATNYANNNGNNNGGGGWFGNNNNNNNNGNNNAYNPARYYGGGGNYGNANNGRYGNAYNNNFNGAYGPNNNGGAGMFGNGGFGNGGNNGNGNNG